MLARMIVEMREWLMSEQNGRQAKTAQRPANNDKRAWQEYWRERGQIWRAEPEIDDDRQVYLTERLRIKIEHEQGIYPFKDIKLSRADVEWLLATHEDERGTAYSRDVGKLLHKGLILSSADLSGVNLQNLPLEDVVFSRANLENAVFLDTHCENALFFDAHMERARLNLAHFEGALLIGAQLAGADLFNAFFDSETRIDNVVFSSEKSGTARFVDVNWNKVNLAVVDWSTVLVLGDEGDARRIEKRGETKK